MPFAREAVHTAEWRARQYELARLGVELARMVEPYHLAVGTVSFIVEGGKGKRIRQACTNLRCAGRKAREILRLSAKNPTEEEAANAE